MLLRINDIDIVLAVNIYCEHPQIAVPYCIGTLENSDVVALGNTYSQESKTIIVKFKYYPFYILRIGGKRCPKYLPVSNYLQ